MQEKILCRLHPSFVFYTILSGVVLGIAISVVTGQLWFRSTWMVVLAIIVIVVCLKNACLLTLMVGFLVGMMLGNLRLTAHISSQDAISKLYRQEVILVGNLIEEPEDKNGSTVVKLHNVRVYDPRGAPKTIQTEKSNNLGIVENFHKMVEKSVDKSVENLVTGGEFQSLEGTIYVTIKGQNRLERSDLIAVVAELNEGFGTFTAKMSRAQLLAIERAESGDIFARFKRWYGERVRGFLPAPEVDLGLGYLMGMKSGLSEDFSEKLRAVGMTHVVVASGAHLVILIGVAKKLFGKISKFAGLLFSLMMIVGFVFIVGFTPSMTRAALVSSLSLLVGYVGRKFTPLRLILFVAAITLVIEPTNFLNLGWQLSFASFFGILILAPRLQKLFYGGKKPPWLASMLLTSLSTLIICAPVMIYNFGTLSLLSFVANLIILPTLPYAMLGMMLVGILSFLPFVATLIALLTTWLLDLHIWVVDFLSSKETFILDFPTNDTKIYLVYVLISAILLLPVIFRRSAKRVIDKDDKSYRFGNND